MKVLLEVEAQTLAEGREWTRQRLEERLQAQADQIGALCPQSGLVLKYVCPAPRLFVGTGHVQRRIISWELARELRRDLTRQWLDAVYG